MRVFFCWLITAHYRDRIEWRSRGQADELVFHCLLCGRVEPVPLHEVHDRARRDFGW